MNLPWYVRLFWQPYTWTQDFTLGRKSFSVMIWYILFWFYLLSWKDSFIPTNKGFPSGVFALYKGFLGSSWVNQSISLLIFIPLLFAWSRSHNCKLEKEISKGNASLVLLFCCVYLLICVLEKCTTWFFSRGFCTCSWSEC